MNEYYVLFTHSTAECGGCLVMHSHNLIGSYESYDGAKAKAVEVGCNPNHIGYEFSIYKTTFGENHES